MKLWLIHNIIKTIISTQSLSLVLHICNCTSKCLLENLIHILAIASRTWKILKPFFLRISYSLSLLNLLASSIVFITHQNNNWILEVDSIRFHDRLPFGKSVETVPIFQIKNKKNNLRPFKERISDLLVITTTTEIKKINSYLPTGYVNLLDTIVNSNSSDVLLDKPPFAISFDDAWFSHFGVADWDELHEWSVTLSRIWLLYICYNNDEIIQLKKKYSNSYFELNKSERTL